jgi:hypothetical protein
MIAESSAAAALSRVTSSGTRSGPIRSLIAARLSEARIVPSCSRGGPSLSFLLLIYPFFDRDFDRYSHWRFRDGPILTRDWLMWEWATWQGKASKPTPFPTLARCANRT